MQVLKVKGSQRFYQQLLQYQTGFINWALYKQRMSQIKCNSHISGTNSFRTNLLGYQIISCKLNRIRLLPDSLALSTTTPSSFCLKLDKVSWVRVQLEKKFVSRTIKVLSLLEACFDFIKGSSLSIMARKITENLWFKFPLRKVKTFLSFFFKFFTQK